MVIIGGENADGLVKKAEVFDAAARSLAASAKLFYARAGHTATRLADGRVIVIGGRGENGVLTATEIYDPATESFSPGPALNRARVGHSATALADGRIFVVGGDGEGSAELYDAATASFTLIEARLSSARAFHAAALLRNGKVLIAGGLSEEMSGVQFGKATINNTGSFDFVVDVDDLGEPGSSDTFAIQMSNGYTAGGQLTGGNIQLH